MANTLTGLIPTLYEALDVVSRELMALVGGVTADAQVARASKGQTVMSFATPAVAASDITPGVTAPNDGDQTISNVPITISKARYVPIRWNGEEQKGINTGPGMGRILVDQFAQAFRTLGNEVEADIVATARKGASRASGTAGTTPFGTANVLTDFAEQRQILADNGAPSSGLQMALGSAAIAKIRGVQSVLFKVNEAGSADLLRMGAVGTVEGYAVRESAQIRLVTKGTGTLYQVNGAHAVGATTIAIDMGSGTVLAGDVITFAGDTNKYVVKTGVAAPGSIEINAPGLLVAHADNDAMTIGNNFIPNLSFARSAIVLATRAPAVPVNAAGNAMDMAEDRMMITDPVSGLTFEISLYLQYRQLKYEVALAWGQSAVKPEHISLLLG